MPEHVAVALYHDPYYTDWIWEQENLYPIWMPEQRYLGRTLNGCQWNGPGFFYEQRPGTGSVARIMRTGSEPALKVAGNRHPRVRTGLYRFFDEAGELLYVGISGDPELRRTQHSKDKSWWPEVMDSTVEWFNNRDVALGKEAAAIRREKPRYNVQHNQAAA
ncbi:GIY-YIG nuclease family protein [Streptomyces nigra]|uniref:GIY-YIG nuclease family protein n=1 Tax=Streptomyces nigra TaxID=1827580 RepID=UPI0036B989FC